MRCPNCGAKMVPGFMPGSPGWCSAECDLKETPAESTKKGWVVAVLACYIQDEKLQWPGNLGTVSWFCAPDLAKAVALADFRDPAQGDPARKRRYFRIDGIEPRLAKLDPPETSVFYVMPLPKGFDLSQCEELQP